jgi:hypothetical protein
MVLRIRLSVLLCVVKTITIKLPDYLNDSLDEAAASRRQTKSAVVRDLLMQALPQAESASVKKSGKPSLHDRLKKYQKAGATGIRDLASNPAHLEGYGR